MVAFLMMMGVTSSAQDKKDKQPVKEPEKTGKDEKRPWKLKSVVRAGYTRPGTPDDTLNKDGTVRPAALNPDDPKARFLGGTIYFVVLERTGADGDTWGTGVGNFNNRFVEGKNTKDNFSPTLDTQAKYLYLYQIVNDRGLDPPPEGVVFATPPSIPVVPIAGASLKLLVDPRYITSWGHFKGTGFIATVPNRNRKGDIVPAAAKKAEDIRMAISSNPSILGELPNRRFMSPAPTHSLKALRESFGLGSATLNLKETAAYAELSKKKAAGKAVAYEDNMIQDAAAAKDPEYVQLLYSGYDEKSALAAASTKPLSYFRADWRGEGIMKLGFHSVVFGFTTDLPPDSNERIFIEDPEAANLGNAKAGNVEEVVDEGFVVMQGQGGGINPAVGTAATPTPPAGGGGGGGGAGLLGGGPTGFGGGGFPGFGGGGIGSAFPAFAGGGGGGGTTGNGNQPQTTPQQQEPQQPQPQPHGGGGNVPAPATIILALLGLPGLYFLRRKKAEGTA
jgi:hypothetical protein